MVVVHRDDGLGRGHIDVLIFKDNAGHIRRAIWVHRDGHHLIAHGLVGSHIGAAGPDFMGAGSQEELLEIQLLAVDVAVHHRHGHLRHGRGRRLVGGLGRGRCHLAVHEGDLRGIGHAGLIHRDRHGIGAGQRIALGIQGAGPHRRGLPRPALHILGVQHRAVLSHIVHRHRHGIGLEFLLGHVAGGHKEQDGHIRLGALHAVEHLVGIFIPGEDCIHLRQPGEARGRVAPFIQEVEGIGRIGGRSLQRQRLPQGRGVHTDPVSPVNAVLHRERRRRPGIARAIRPVDVQGQGIPDISRHRGGKAGGDQQHRRQQQSQQTVVMRSASTEHGVSLLTQKS